MSKFFNQNSDYKNKNKNEKALINRKNEIKRDNSGLQDSELTTHKQKSLDLHYMNSYY